MTLYALLTRVYSTGYSEFRFSTIEFEVKTFQLEHLRVYIWPARIAHDDRAIPVMWDIGFDMV